MHDAWMFRRLLKANFVTERCPLFVLSDDAANAAISLMKSEEDTRTIEQFAPLPHPTFCVEFRDPKVETSGNDKNRLQLGERILILVNGPTETTREVCWFFPSKMAPAGLILFSYGRVNLETDGFSVPSPFTNGVFNPVELHRIKDPFEQRGILCNYYSSGNISEISEKDAQEQLTNNAWVVWRTALAACAVIATPGLPREEGRARGPEPKIRQRGAASKAPEFAYTRISLDIDRTVSGGEKAQEAEARKLALHRVRAHLRFIKDKGLVPVRSHMRGNAAHGVRIGRTLVHKGGN